VKISFAGRGEALMRPLVLCCLVLAEIGSIKSLSGAGNSLVQPVRWIGQSPASCSGPLRVRFACGGYWTDYTRGKREMDAQFVPMSMGSFWKCFTDISTTPRKVLERLDHRLCIFFLSVGCFRVDFA